MNILSALKKVITTALICACCFILSACSGLPTGGGFWNTNLRMVNILELENPSAKRQRYTVEVYDNVGKKFAEKTYSLAGYAQQDIILNDTFLQGRENQSGAIGITSSDYDNLQARISYYRWNPSETAVEFAYSVPADGMSVIRLAPTTVPFNSTQPSYNPADANAQVDEWLSIVNLSEKSRVFTVNTYNQAGKQIDTKRIYIRSHERRDIKAGDTRVLAKDSAEERAMIGLHEVVPAVDETYYALQLTRYGHKGSNPDEYAFAVPVLSNMVMIPLTFVPISTGAGADTYVELANQSAISGRCSVTITDYDGKIKLSKTFFLKAHQQIHIDASSYLEPGQSGMFMAYQKDRQSEDEDTSIGITATSVSYYRNDDGSIKTTSSSPTVFPIGSEQVTSYNLYLDSENWLRLFNYNRKAVTITMSVVDGSGNIKEKQYRLQPSHGIELPLHEFAKYGTLANTYGEITITGELVGEMLRIGGQRAGDIDFAISTPIGSTSPIIVGN